MPTFDDIKLGVIAGYTRNLQEINSTENTELVELN